MTAFQKIVASVWLVGHVYVGSVSMADEPVATVKSDPESVESQPNAENSVEDGFVSLFNGKNLDGWKTTGNWVVNEEGVLSLKPKKKGFRLFPDIKQFLWCKETFDNFVLKLEFKIENECRSGVFVRCKSMSQYLEVQVADSAGHEGPPRRVDCGSLVDVCLPSENAAKPAGQWNQMTITCDGTRVAVDLNSRRVVDYDLASATNTKAITSGHLGFQHQGDEVHFRNIRVKRLPGLPIERF